MRYVLCILTGVLLFTSCRSSLIKRRYSNGWYSASPAKPFAQTEKPFAGNSAKSIRKIDSDFVPQGKQDSVVILDKKLAENNIGSRSSKISHDQIRDPKEFKRKKSRLAQNRSLEREPHSRVKNFFKYWIIVWALLLGVAFFVIGFAENFSGAIIIVILAFVGLAVLTLVMVLICAIFISIKSIIELNRKKKESVR